MANTSVPHFDLPFRFLEGGTGVAVVEQDSYEDIADCVETIIRCPLGWRNDNTEFGTVPMEFSKNPSLDAQDIQTQEPRVALLTAAQRSALDSMIHKLTAEVQ